MSAYPAVGSGRCASRKERAMQRRDFGWFHPLGRLNLVALAAAMLAITGGCTGTIGPVQTGGGAEGGSPGAGGNTTTGVGSGAGSGSAGNSGSVGSMGSAGAGNTTIVTGTAGAG